MLVRFCPHFFVLTFFHWSVLQGIFLSLQCNWQQIDHIVWKAICRITDKDWCFSGLLRPCPTEWHGLEFCMLAEQGDSSQSWGASAWLNLNFCMWRINGYMKQYFLLSHSPSSYLSEFKRLAEAFLFPSFSEDLCLPEKTEFDILPM